VVQLHDYHHGVSVAMERPDGTRSGLWMPVEPGIKASRYLIEPDLTADLRRRLLAS